MNEKDRGEDPGPGRHAAQAPVLPGSRYGLPNPLPYLGNLVRPLLRGVDTEGRLALLYSIERRGCGPPCHRHRNEDELVYVLEGEITFFTGDGPRQVPAGSCLFLPKSGEHCYAVESEEARMLTVALPAGIEDYYLELGDYQGEPDIERLVTVAARYGIEITGPSVESAEASMNASPQIPDGGDWKWTANWGSLVSTLRVGMVDESWPTRRTVTSSVETGGDEGDDVR